MPQAEAKYPALLFFFKQQLTSYVEKIFCITRDNLKKELGELLALCIHICSAPRGKCVAITVVIWKRRHTNHWESIVDCLNSILSTLKENMPLLLVVVSCSGIHMVTPNKKANYWGLLNRWLYLLESGLKSELSNILARSLVPEPLKIDRSINMICSIEVIFYYVIFRMYSQFCLE